MISVRISHRVYFGVNCGSKCSYECQTSAPVQACSFSYFLLLHSMLLPSGYWRAAKTSKAVEKEVERIEERDGKAGETEVEEQERLQEGKEGAVLERKV